MSHAQMDISTHLDTSTQNLTNLEGTTSWKKTPPFSRLEIARGLGKSSEHVTVVYQPDRNLVPPVEKEKEISFFE